MMANSPKHVLQMSVLWCFSKCSLKGERSPYSLSSGNSWLHKVQLVYSFNVWLFNAILYLSMLSASKIKMQIIIFYTLEHWHLDGTTVFFFKESSRGAWFHENKLRNSWVTVTNFSSVAQSCLTLCDPMDCSTVTN